MARLKVDEEREYNVPLRHDWLKVPRWRRSKRAVDALRVFVVKHTKMDDVRISRWVNETIWAKGAKTPPHHILVKVKKVSEKKDKETFEHIDVELPKITKRAERIEKKFKAIVERIKKEELPKRAETPKAEAEKLIETIKGKGKKSDKRKAAKELLAELEEAKAAEDKKKQAKMTKKQEIASKK